MKIPISMFSANHVKFQGSPTVAPQRLEPLKNDEVRFSALPEKPLEEMDEEALVQKLGKIVLEGSLDDLENFDREFTRLNLGRKVWGNIYDKPDFSGFTPLMNAASRGKTEAIRFLKQKNADLFLTNDKVESFSRFDHRTFHSVATAFHEAAFAGHLDALRELFKDVSPEQAQEIINRPNKYGVTMMFAATASGNCDLIGYLKELGGSLDAEDIAYGNLVSKAIEFLHPAALGYLRMNGAPLTNAKQQDASLGLFVPPPHHLALRNNYRKHPENHLKQLDILKQLLDEGMSVNHKNWEGETMLDLALRNEDEDAVALILKYNPTEETLEQGLLTINTVVEELQSECERWKVGDHKKTGKYRNIQAIENQLTQKIETLKNQ